ncbi:hypothetical protein FACS1894184_11760 [Clostridia bacterium]|nr:hypothetical protein FACS1894184_11760 [Clostridia bacterium]
MNSDREHMDKFDLGGVLGQLFTINDLDELGPLAAFDKWYEQVRAQMEKNFPNIEVKAEGVTVDASGAKVDVKIGDDGTVVNAETGKRIELKPGEIVYNTEGVPTHIGNTAGLAIEVGPVTLTPQSVVYDTTRRGNRRSRQRRPDIQGQRRHAGGNAWPSYHDPDRRDADPGHGRAVV